MPQLRASFWCCRTSRGGRFRRGGRRVEGEAFIGALCCPHKASRFALVWDGGLKASVSLYRCGARCVVVGVGSGVEFLLVDYDQSLVFLLGCILGRLVVLWHVASRLVLRQCRGHDRDDVFPCYR